MPRLLNNQTKMIEIVPDDVVSQYIASGQYSPRQGSLLNAISPTGDVGTIPAETAQIAFQQGYSYQSRENAKNVTDAKIKQVYREQYDMPGVAAAAGALRGITFGLSDVAMRAFGGADLAAGLEQVKEISPIASTVGEIGGVVASLPSALASAGVRGAAAVGAAVTEQTVAKIAAKYGTESIITKAAQMGAGTAVGMGVEGALYGAGTVISEAALSDPELNAQHAAATVGLGALAGGVFGGVTKAGGEAIKAFRGALHDSTLPSAAANVIGKATSKAISLARGMSPEDSAKLTNLFATTEGRSLVWQSMQDKNVAIESMKNGMSELHKLGDAFANVAGEARKAARAELESKSVGPLRFVVRKDVNKSIDDAINTISKQSEFYQKDAIPALNQIKENFGTDVLAVTNRTELHQKLEHYRQLVDSKMKFSFAERSGASDRTEKVYNEVRSKFNELLTSKIKFGKFAEEYADINSSYNKWYSARKNFYKTFGSKQINEKGIEEIAIDTNKINTYFTNPETEKNVEKILKLDTYIDSLKGLESVARKTGKSNPELSDFLLKETADARASIQKITDARTAQTFLNHVETMTGKAWLGGGLGALAGNMVGGPAAMFIGAAAGAAAATPKSALRILFAIENHGIAGQHRLQSAVSNFYGNRLTAAAGTAVRGVSIIAKPVTIKSAIEFLGEEGSSVHDLKKALDVHANNPQKIWQNFDDNNQHLDQVAPEYSTHMINVMSRGIQFLQQKMPANYTNDMFGSRKAPISDSQNRAIATYVDAIFRPNRIYEELEKQRPDPLVVEAIQSVYPKLYGAMQHEVMKQATDSHVSYQQKLVLGRLFALPTTTSLDRISEYQKAFIAPPAPQQRAASNAVVDMKSLATSQTTTDALQM